MCNCLLDASFTRSATVLLDGVTVLPLASEAAVLRVFEAGCCERIDRLFVLVCPSSTVSLAFVSVGFRDDDDDGGGDDDDGEDDDNDVDDEGPAFNEDVLSASSSTLLDKSDNDNADSKGEEDTGANDDELRRKALPWGCGWQTARVGQSSGSLLACCMTTTICAVPAHDTEQATLVMG